MESPSPRKRARGCSQCGCYSRTKCGCYTPPAKKKPPVCPHPCAHRQCIIGRLTEFLPLQSRRPKEPDPADLFAQHAVPACAAGRLRVCTLNLLDDVHVALGQGGLHAVWEVRRVNVLRVLLAINAEAYLLQELNDKSADFLRGTMRDYSLVRWQGLGVLYRRVPGSPDRVWLEPEGCPAQRRSIRASGSRRQVIGSCLHVPFRVHQLTGPNSLVCVVLTSLKLTVGSKTGLVSSDLEAKQFGAALGRDLLRLPERAAELMWTGRSWVPMVAGGDFNASKEGALHAELTSGVRRQPAGSEDEWEEDKEASAEGEPRWPPQGKVRLAVDLWQAAKPDRREHGGLQRGSSCLSMLFQNYDGRLQGVKARAANQGWPEDGPCTDSGHIDWLLASTVGGQGPGIKVDRVMLCTELLCPPLPPIKPERVGDRRLPKGGAVFPSDHYPVVADIKFVRPRAS